MSMTRREVLEMGLSIMPGKPTPEGRAVFEMWADGNLTFEQTQELIERMHRNREEEEGR